MSSFNHINFLFICYLAVTTYVIIHYCIVLLIINALTQGLGNRKTQNLSYNFNQFVCSHFHQGWLKYSICISFCIMCNMWCSQLCISSDAWLLKDKVGDILIYSRRKNWLNPHSLARNVDWNQTKQQLQNLHCYNITGFRLQTASAKVAV